MEPQPESSGRESFLTIILALLFGGGFLVLLILLTGIFFLYVILAALAVGSVGFLHYVLWGQALTDETAMERAAEEQKMRQEANQYAGGRQDHIRRL